MYGFQVIFIVGTTGVGKTKLSIELAKALDTEIISADSIQVNMLDIEPVVLSGCYNVIDIVFN